MRVANKGVGYFMKWWKSRPLYTKIFIGLILGIIVGFVAGEQVSFIMQPIGDIFLRMLQMLVAPVVFFTIVNGITKMEDTKTLASVGGRLFVYYALTSLLAVVVGAGLAMITQPGKGSTAFLDENAQVDASDFNLIDNIVSWVPTNPFQALNEANVLQILFFAIMLGITLLLLGDKAKGVINLFDEGTEIMFKITDIVMSFSPYGILALMSELVHTLDLSTLAQVGVFILTDYAGLLIILLIVYPIQLKFMSKIPVIPFFKAVSPVMLVAASTTSSAACLPVSLKLADESFHVPEKIYGFGLTAGSSINSNGMAVAIGVISVFACNLYGMPLTAGIVTQFIITGLLLSMGTAGVKGAGVVLSTVMLQSLGLPLTLVPVLAAIWPIIDIGHTTMNVVGDMVGVCIIADRSGEMDTERFKKEFGK